MKYFENIGIAWDMFLNALLGGVAGQTLSMRAALAAKTGNRAACIVCAVLAWLVQRDHCKDQLDGVQMGVWNYVRAACGMLVLTLILATPLVWIAAYLMRYK